MCFYYVLYVEIRTFIKKSRETKLTIQLFDYPYHNQKFNKKEDEIAVSCIHKYFAEIPSRNNFLNNLSTYDFTYGSSDYPPNLVPFYPYL